MKSKFIPAGESFRQWMKDRTYTAAYEELGKEFSAVSAMVEAKRKEKTTETDDLSDDGKR